MSFTNQIAEELLRLPVKKTCCRKALALGLALAARREERGEVLYLYDEQVALLAESVLSRVFRADTTLTRTVRAGRETFVLIFRSAAVSAFLETVDAAASDLREAVGFRCAVCEAHFLRGVFFTCATVTDPRKGYHLEWILPTEGRADALSSLLLETVGKAGRARRGTRYGVYYKNNGAISDLLYLIGCSKTSFEVTNASIEREIRNNENRATNCVARNILRSVDASRKQIAAIETLIATRKIDTLSEELRITARLRLDNEDASLAELALLHDPPLTKSGLNRRLQRLLAEAEELAKK
jgi:DNA-binding protein WhiA